jgi:hypothetical protein
VDRPQEHARALARAARPLVDHARPVGRRSRWMTRCFFPFFLPSPRVFGRAY